MSAAGAGDPGSGPPAPAGDTRGGQPADPAPRAAGGPLRHREFRLLFAGQAVSVLGDAIFPVALAFAVLDELGGSAGALSVVLLAKTVPMTMLVLAAGVWADRLPRRMLMLLSDFGRLGCQAALGALLLTGTAALWHAIALVALYGAFEALFRPALGGLVPQLVPAAELQRASALLGGAITAGMVLGPAIAGALVVAIGAGAAVAVDAATFAVSAACLGLMTAPPRALREAPAASARFVREIRDGLGEVWARPWLRAALPVFALYHLVSLPCTLALGPALMDAELGGAAAWATASTCFGIGALTGAATAYRIHPRRPMVAAIGGLSFAALQPVAIALGGSTPVIAAALAVGGFGIAFGYTVWEATLGREIPEARISRIVSVDHFATLGLMPVGFAVAGALGEGLGLRPVMVAAGVGVWLVALAATRVPGVRRLAHAV